MNIRRTEFLFFYHNNQTLPDLKYLLVNKKMDTNLLYAIPILFGQEIVISRKELQLLLAISTKNWVAADSISIKEKKLNRFIKSGILLSDDPTDPVAKIFKQRDDLLKNQKWNIYGALYFFMTKWRNVDINLPKTIANQSKAQPDYLKNLTVSSPDSFGIPSHFHQKGKAKKSIPLLSKFKENKLLKTLKRRKTHRNFNPTIPMKKKQLSKLLYYTFGVQGIAAVHPGLSLLKKTSPSPGSLHSIEVYLLILNVKGLNPGIYHYNAQQNALFPIKKYGLKEAKNKAKLFAAGNNFVADSNVLLLLSSRFYRYNWKYNHHPNAIGNIFKECAHHCQNFYLLCTEMGLGAYTTIMNQQNIEEALGLNGFEEGIFMLMGCGQITKTAEKKYPEYKFKD